ncbi:hypothetical protein [Bradyrhizobium sp. AZCC 2289]|uniref:hypothetical protein n=1 Tax=Bradyrhizobium sp. AZCC 2289 TaxID=3117026 RepID=UPI002FF3078E
MKETVAYVSVDDLAGLQQEPPEPEDGVSSEAGRKRKQRKIDENGGFHYFNVKMPIDDPALKETVKTVAATLIKDRKVHHTFDALVSDPAVREIVDCATSSAGGAVLIAKAARTGGLLRMASVAAADGELTQCLAQLVEDGTALKAIRIVAMALIGDREFYRTLVALVSNPLLRETVDCTSLEPGGMTLIAKAARSGGLLQMAKVAEANGELAQCLAQLAENGVLLKAISVLVGSFNKVAAEGSVEAPLRAATAAMRDPAATLRFCEVRARGGIRAQILDWILGLA